jgi:hypothetical protein
LANLDTDENFPVQVVFLLREFGHNVLTAKEAGKANKGLNDDVVLADALAAGRILLTENRRDFVRRHNAGKPHQGIIVCRHVPDFELYARLINEAIASAPPEQRWLLRVRRPG